MKHLLTFLFSLLLLSTLASQDSLLLQTLQSHTYPFTGNNLQFSGEGIDFLKNEATRSPFFLIGEDHGIADIPLFTGTFFQLLRPLGYDYFATETGPYTAEMVQEMAAGADWEAMFRDHFEKYPWSIPFYQWKEECLMAHQILNSGSEQEVEFWGLDQEFAASFRMYFKKLETEATTDESKQMAAEYYQLAEKSFKESYETKNPAKSFIGIMTPADFVKLKEVFRGQTEALALLQELEESIQIYQLWFTGGGYESNCLRAEMMKRHFIKYYERAVRLGASPKVLFKFGANHMYRGHNGLNVPDIGNFVSELASQQGTHSFHLYVIGRKGTQNRHTPFSPDDSDKKATYDPAKYLDKIDFTAVLKAAPSSKWTVIDLRPLRKMLFNRQLKNLPNGMEKLIWGYDGVMVIPEVRASVEVGE